MCTAAIFVGQDVLPRFNVTKEQYEKQNFPITNLCDRKLSLKCKKCPDTESCNILCMSKLSALHCPCKTLLNKTTVNSYQQGFMYDKIIASRTCFGEHMDVNC